jgi:hypothetical protein
MPRFDVMKMPSFCVLAVLATAACSATSTPLQDGYTIVYGDRGKSWLANPDGTMAHPGLIKQIFKDYRHILLITFAATYEGEVKGPRPLDGNCYVALLITSKERLTRQVRLAEARRFASKMAMVESSGRGCLMGMPTS